MIHRRTFWEGWRNRLDNNFTKYITPDDKMVIEAAKVSGANSSDSPSQRAIDVWVYVADTIDYKLSKRWKKPSRTLQDGIGDCEDVTFLLASMFPNVGIEQSELVIGTLVHTDGRREEHTWNRVNGMTIDATGMPDVVSELEYKEVFSWTINTKMAKSVV